MNKLTTYNTLKNEPDIKTLIKLVENRPCLWDKYSKASLRERIEFWREICVHFAPNFPKMEAYQQSELMEYVQLRWQHLRDYFLRCVKKTPRKKYKYHENIKFLLKNMDADEKPNIEDLDLDRTLSTPNKPENEDRSDSTVARRHSTRSPCPRQVSPVLQVSMKRGRGRPKNCSPESARVNSPKRQRLNDETPHLSLSSLNNGCVLSPEAAPSGLESNQNAIPDEDEAFFLSIMPRIKKLSDDEKLDFRMNVLACIRDLSLQSKMKSEVSSSLPGGVIFMTQDDFPQTTTD